MLIVVAVAFIPNWSTQRPDPALVGAIRAATDRPTVALIGSDMAAGHPLDRAIDGRYVSTHVSDWLGAFSLYLSRQATASGDTARAARYQDIMVRYAESKREEFERLRPDVVIFQKDDIYWTSRLAERFGFDAILARYRVLVENDTLRIYLRDDYVRPGPLTVGRFTPASSPASASD
jgi:hypothetical protein